MVKDWAEGGGFEGFVVFMIEVRLFKVEVKLFEIKIA